MQKWEYSWEPVGNFTLDYRKHLNELGAQGWEFVGLFPGDEGSPAQHFVLTSEALKMGPGIIRQLKSTLVDSHQSGRRPFGFAEG